MPENLAVALHHPRPARFRLGCLSCVFNTMAQLVAMIESAAVLEAAGGPHSPWIDAANREKLAGIVAGSLRLKVRFLVSTL